MSVRTVASVLGLVLGPLLLGIEEARPAEKGKRVATISTIHPPHQGFALAAEVESDLACLALGQNLAAEIGIKVDVICSDSKGSVTAVAQCGFAASRDAEEIGAWRKGGLLQEESEFLVCIPPEATRFRAKRVTPSLDRLRR